MVKFFETLLNKFFDFFNFGRFITIIVPGLITALCFTMLISQLIFPAREELEPLPVSKVQSKEKKEIKSESKRKNEKDESRETVETTTIVKEITTNEVGMGHKLTGQEVVKKEDKEALFRRQILEDYTRVSGNFSNFSLVILLTIVIGLLLYELGYRVLFSFPRKENEEKLFRYNPQHDADDKVTHKFGFSEEPVGLVYFAPFLKERFSGEENYFNFIVTEYYRFVEFSVNMPISIIVSSIIGLAYYGLFSLRNCYWPYWREFTAFFLILFVVSIVFLRFVSPKIFTAYKKASKDLVQGVSDLMSKGLK